MIALAKSFNHTKILFALLLSLLNLQTQRELVWFFPCITSWICSDLSFTEPQTQSCLDFMGIKTQLLICDLFREDRFWICVWICLYQVQCWNSECCFHIWQQPWRRPGNASVENEHLPLASSWGLQVQNHLWWASAMWHHLRRGKKSAGGNFKRLT